MSLGLRGRIVAGLSVVLVIHLAVGIAAVSSLRNLIRTDAQVAHTQEVRTTIQDLRALLFAAESGQRGYVLSGDSAFLPAWLEAEASIDDHLAGLRRLTADNPAQQQRVDSIAPLAAARLGRLSEVIAVRNARGLEAAAAEVAQARGRLLMGRIRAHLNAMEAEEIALLAPRIERASAGAIQTVAVVVVGAVLALVVAVGGGLLGLTAATLRLRAEDELRTAVELLEEVTRLQKAVLDATDSMIISTDTDGTIRTWNAAAARLLGWQAGEVVGVQTPAVMHDAAEVGARAAALSASLGVPVAPGFEALVAEARRRLPSQHEWTFVRKDGSRFPVLLSVTAIRSERDEITGFLGTAVDLTERKAFEAARAASEARLASVVAVMADGIVVQDARGAVVDCNAAAERILCLSREAVLRLHDPGTPWLAFHEDGTPFPREDHPALVTLRTGASISNVVMGMRRADRTEHWLLINSRPMPGGGVVSSFSDITRRREAEEALRAANAALEQARDAADEANRAKSEFLANMSHELRTPLNSVIGFASILRKNKKGNLLPTDLEYLERVDANGRHLLGLINSILDLSKIEAGRMELELAPVPLGPFVTDTLAQFQPQLQDRPVTLVADVPDGLATLEADAGKLKQVLINLVANALKFTERGSVTLRVVADPATGAPLRLEIADTGIGIPPERQQAVFEAFQQADNTTARRFGGTGLGLTITRSLLQLMGYTITLESAVGVGSTFRIHLHAAAARHAAIPARSAPDPAADVAAADTTERPLVLVIDDDADARLLLAQFIADAGCRCVAVGTGAQGLESARALRPDLITLDVMMPHMNGLEVLARMQADPALQAIPVVLVSIVAQEQRGRAVGAVAFVDKPVSREDIERVVREQLASRTQRADEELRERLNSIAERFHPEGDHA